MTSPPSSARQLDEHVRRRGGEFGQRVRALRHQRRLTVRELAARSGIASSTISKVENARMSPTYDNILRLAKGLGVEVEKLFNEEAATMQAGVRSITRAGEGVVVKARNYHYEVLSADISNKKFFPFVATIESDEIVEAHRLFRHSGEEFVYVLDGCVVVLTDIYAPLQLHRGDSCYFDSSMGHMLVSCRTQNATVLWVASSIEPELFAEARTAPSGGAPRTRR